MNQLKENNIEIGAKTEIIISELDWLDKIIQARVKEKYSQLSGESKNIIELLPPPFIAAQESVYGDFVCSQNLRDEERFLLILALATHVKPDIFELHLAGATNRAGRSLSIAGGLVGEQYRGFIPTGLTFLYLLAGRDTTYRLELIERLFSNNKLVKNGVISFNEQGIIDPILSGAIVLNSDHLKKFIGIKIN